MNESDECNPSRKSGYIDALTGARFLAIIIIVFAHLDFLKDYDVLSKWWYWWHNATMGVDFFFMMSGFGMMLSSIRKNSNEAPIVGLRGSLKYGIRHVKKIYPIYSTMLLIGIPYKIIVGLLKFDTNIVKEVTKCIIYFLMDLTLLQTAAGHVNFSISLNPVGWFLSSLFCIYLASPFIMQSLKKHVKSARTALIGIILCVTSSYLLAIVFTSIAKKILFFDNLCYGSPYRRIFYVILGMLLAQIYTFHQKNVSHATTLLFTSGIFEYISIGFSMIWFFWWHQFSETYWVYIVNMIIVACDLYAIALHQGKMSKWLASKPMVYLGNISMYIYITHYLIRAYVDLIVKMIGIRALPIAIGETIIILSLTLWISARLYKHDGKITFFTHIINLIVPFTTN